MSDPRLPTIRFSRFHRQALYSVFTLLWVSGALWLVFHYFLQMPGDFGNRAHPLERWWLRLHGLVVFAMLVAVGSVLPVHARQAWKLKRNLLSGLSMKLVVLWLAGTGYALYYFASEANQSWLALLHWAVGLPLPLLIAFHARHRYRRPQPRGAARPDAQAR